MDILELPRPVINFLRTMAKESYHYTLSWDIFGGHESVTLALTWKTTRKTIVDESVKDSPDSSPVEFPNRDEQQTASPPEIRRMKNSNFVEKSSPKLVRTTGPSKINRTTKEKSALKRTDRSISSRRSIRDSNVEQFDDPWIQRNELIDEDKFESNVNYEERIETTIGKVKFKSKPEFM